MNFNEEIGSGECIRCGECCLSASPTLQRSDIGLVIEGIIQTRNLYTIRSGEMVHDNIHGGLHVTRQEMIKVREGPGSGACVFYDDTQKACTIYASRPAQCEAFSCWDTDEFMRAYNRPKADRRGIVEDEALLRLMEEHERRCSYFLLEAWVKKIPEQGEKAVDAVLAALKFDHHIRPFISERLQRDKAEMDFLFGRPLTETISMFGLKVVRSPDGSFLLTVLEGQDREATSRSLP